MSDSDRISAGSVTIPRIPGWEDRTVLTLVGPATEGAQPNVVVTRERLCDNMGLGGFSSGWVQKLADQVPVQEKKDIEHIEISGAPAHLRVVEWEAAGLRLRGRTFHNWGQRQRSQKRHHRRPHQPRQRPQDSALAARELLAQRLPSRTPAPMALFEE